MILVVVEEGGCWRLDVALACNWLMLINWLGENLNLLARERAHEESKTVVGLSVVLLRLLVSLEGNTPLEVCCNNQMVQWLSIGQC